MAERFEKLFSLPPNLYSKGSPVIISAGSLLKDTETGKIVVQIKFHSVSFTPIKALKIDIAAYDVSGKEIEGVNDYQYLDLKINNGEEFGSNKAIVLPNTVARSFSINNISVVFSNGSTVNMLFPLKALPESKTLVSELSNVELARQYQLKTNKNATYVPFVLDELWFCSCGSWNSNHICTNCGLNKEKAIENLDVSRLEPEMNTRLQAEKIERIQQQELAEKKAKEEQILKEKNKKKKRSIAVLATIAIVLFVGALIYSSQHKFDDIAGVYALCNLEEAEEALYEFQEDSIDEYGFNPYSYEIEIKGSGKVYGLWFVNNRGSMTPRAATVKSVSKDGVVEFDVLDYPDAEVNLTVDIETGEATYSSRNLTLDYRRITEELAENGYKEYSSKEIGKDISFVQDLFELNSANKILEKYKDATAEDAKYDVKIEGAFCGAEGTYQIWELDGIYRIIFEQGIYDTNTEKENLIEALNSVLGEYKYSSSFEAYTWKSAEYNMQIDYWPHEGIYFFRDSQESNSDTKEDILNDNPQNSSDSEKTVGVRGLKAAVPQDWKVYNQASENLGRASIGSDNEYRSWYISYEGEYASFSEFISNNPDEVYEADAPSDYRDWDVDGCKEGFIYTGNVDGELVVDFYVVCKGHIFNLTYSSRTGNDNESKTEAEELLNQVDFAGFIFD